MNFLRQQKLKENESSYFCLSDFIAPTNSNQKDYIAVFAVTTGTEVEEYAENLKVNNDDYNSLLVKALADRLAEASAELIHKKSREIFGFGLNENLTNEDLIKEKYRGIRPAPGYPSTPDHLEKKKIWQLLNVDSKINIELTENLAMTPASSVCGLIFNHPEAKYFNLGLIEHDQIELYAKISNHPKEFIEKWLRTNLSYDH